MPSIHQHATSTQQKLAEEVRNLFVRTKAKTFWESLCSGCQKASVDTEISRKLGAQTAWNIAGETLVYFNQKVVHVIHAIFETHKKEILRGSSWDRNIDCWMVGHRPDVAVPQIVISCMDLPMVKRFMRRLKSDEVLRSSGFAVVGKKARYDLTVGGPQLIESDSDASKMVDFCGLQVNITSDEAETGILPSIATLGGIVMIDYDRLDDPNSGLYALTTVHPFLKPNPTTDDQDVRPWSEVDSEDIISWDDIESDEESSESNSSILSESDDEADVDHVEADASSGKQLVLRHTDIVLRNATIGDSLAESGPLAVATLQGHEVAPVQASLAGDWALLTLVAEPSTIYNEVQYQGEKLVVSGSQNIADNTEVISIRPKHGEPKLYKCSGAVSLISIAGQTSLQKAHRLYGQFAPGDSGSWIISPESGDLYGIVIANSIDNNCGYMLPCDDVFSSIRTHLSTVNKSNPSVLKHHSGARDHDSKSRQQESRDRRPDMYHHRDTVPDYMPNTWIRLSDKHVLPETLDHYQLDWQYDKDDQHSFLIMENISHELTREIFAHSRMLMGDDHDLPIIETRDRITHKSEPEGFVKTRSVWNSAGFKSRTDSPIRQGYTKQERKIGEHTDTQKFDNRIPSSPSTSTVSSVDFARRDRGLDRMHSQTRQVPKDGHLAIRTQSPVDITISLPSKQNINSKDISGRTPLHRAVMLGQESVVRALLRNQDVDVLATDNTDRSALLLVSHERYIQPNLYKVPVRGDLIPTQYRNEKVLARFARIIQMLLPRSPLSKFHDNTGTDALRTASSFGHAGLVQQLLQDETGFPIHVQAFRTAMLCAIEAGHGDVVQTLLNKCSELGLPREDFWELLPEVASQDEAEVMLIMLKHEFFDDKIMFRTEWNGPFKNAILMAAGQRNLRVLKILLEDRCFNLCTKADKHNMLVSIRRKTFGTSRAREAEDLTKGRMNRM